MTTLGHLTTEGRNPASEAIDRMSALEIVRLINGEDARIAAAVGKEAEAIARAIEAIADRLRAGGRLVYLGAGTSGRLGVLDAAECPPTFNAPPGLVVGLIAGGPHAMTQSIEGAEDRPESAVADLESISLTAGDVVVGIATSGRTPYVLGGLAYARARGAYAIGIACNEDASLASHADLAITPIVGPEVISGSTRMKAGTATKMVLNMLSTGAMVLLGKTYGNLMVDLQATNSKLAERSRRIVAALTGRSPDEVDRALTQCHGEVKTAILVLRCSIAPDEARQRLRRHGGRLRRALDEMLPNDELVLGIDGGGSKTVAWIARCQAGDELTVVGRGVSGGSNPQAVGLKAAMASLSQAVEAARSQAGAGPGPLAAAFVGLAGSGRAEIQEPVLRWAEEHQVARCCRVDHDALSVLAAEPIAGWGVALISGTGSMAFGLDRQGRTARAGGWGFLLGDEGSGYAIARAGLRAAAQAADGRGSATRLLGAFLMRLECRQPADLISTVHRIVGDPGAVAALAPVVLEAAASADAVARAIVVQAGCDLAAMVAAVAEKLGFGGGPFPLAMTGGVLLADSLLRQSLKSSLAERDLHPEPVVPVPDPVAGALRLAAQLRTASRRRR